MTIAFQGREIQGQLISSASGNSAWPGRVGIDDHDDHHVLSRHLHFLGWRKQELDQRETPVELSAGFFLR